MMCRTSGRLVCMALLIACLAGCAGGHPAPPGIQSSHLPEELSGATRGSDGGGGGGGSGGV